MFMPNIVNYSYIIINLTCIITSARATCKRRSGSEGGDRAWAGLGGRAPGTLGRCTLCTGTPQGGVGGRKSGI